MVENAVEIDDLSVAFGDFLAVDKVSFSVRRGEIFGFLGANGAGKTTTIRVMCGLLIPTSGSVRIAGLPLTAGGKKLVKEKVGYMSQKFTLYDDLTVAENMAFKASLRSIPRSAAKIKQKELFDLIGFKYSENTLVRDLPAGIKQQISLAATLLHDPEIIFLDEPTSGVSPSVRARFWELIRALAGEGKTVIVTTHYMDEAEQCERIALMRSGKLIALDSPAELKKKAYPEPVAEIKVSAGTNDAKTIFSNDAVTAWWPYGAKYHAALRSKKEAESFISGLPAGASGRLITPSLEDVFIKLVEGHNR